MLPIWELDRVFLAAATSILTSDGGVTTVILIVICESTWRTAIATAIFSGAVIPTEMESASSGGAAQREMETSFVLMTIYDDAIMKIVMVSETALLGRTQHRLAKLAQMLGVPREARPAAPSSLLAAQE